MTRYLNQLHENTAPVAGDYVLTYDASAAAGDEDRWANISKFAILANGQTFTATQGISPISTSSIALSINMPASTIANALNVYYNNAIRQHIVANNASNTFVIDAFDNGNSYGGVVQIGRNNNASTPGSGFVYIENKNGTNYSVWPDGSGNLRILAGAVTNAFDTSGTVVGTQTSMAEAKHIVDALPNLRESLAAILSAAKTGLRAWTYKSGAFGGELFPCGIVTDYAPRYGMDRDGEHPHGKSLNVPVAIGDLMASIALLHERITALEGV